MMTIPKTRYAKSGNINLAYQVIGGHKEYLILIPGWVSNVEEVWNIPQLAAWLQYLASLNTLVIFDKRGTGLSDRVDENDLPDVKQRVEDLRIIMSDAGIKKANLLGLSEGGPFAIFLATHYPKRVNKLILLGSFAKWTKTEDYPYGLTEEQHHQVKDYLVNNWGKPLGLKVMAPSVQNDQQAQNQWAKFLRNSASPGTAKMFYEMNMMLDVRSYLNQVTCPTLIMHRKGDRLIEYQHARYMHERIHDAQLVISEGTDHFPWFSIRRSELITLQTFLEDGKAIHNPRLEMLAVKDIFILYEIKSYLINNYALDTSIKDLSKKFAINEFKIKSGFRLLFGSPVIGFLSEVRLRKACELLADPEETVASVSEQVGYKHSNNFSIAFKRRFELTPLQYKLKIARP